MWYHNRMSNIRTIIEKINNKPYNSNIKLSELTAYYEHYGFSVVRTTGSHYIFKNLTGKIVSVPSHDNKVKASYVKQAYETIKNMEERNEKEG